MDNRWPSSLKRLAFISLITLSIVCKVALAGPLEDGRAAWGNGDFASAMSILLPLANQGNPLAEYLVGLMYSNAQGVTENGAEGARWFEKAADGGNIDASYALCQNFSVGRIGLSPDLVRSYAWCDRAAKGYLAAKRSDAAGNAIAFRDLVGRKLSDKELAEAKKQAETWTAAP